MSRAQAERYAKQNMMSGFYHHTFEDERYTYNHLFQTPRDHLLKFLNQPETDLLLLRYTDVLGPTHMRSLRNSLICLITSICRNAIDHGINVELSFSLSDYYINQLELVDTENELLTLSKQIIMHYYDLVQAEKQKCYSKHIAGAIRFIARNLYAPCKVSAVAAHVHLEQHYFSSLFTKEVGITPSKYILHCKLEEAYRLLSEGGITITEVSEALQFSDVSHLSRCFKTKYGLTPSQVFKRDAPRNG